MSAPERMTALAETFPALRGKPGVRPWDPVALDRAAAKGTWSEAVTDCARFVLAVWNDDAPWKVGRFDLMRAVARWDRDNRAAAVAWLSAPWWP